MILDNIDLLGFSINNGGFTGCSILLEDDTYKEIVDYDLDMATYTMVLEFINGDKQEILLRKKVTLDVPNYNHVKPNKERLKAK